MKNKLIIILIITTLLCGCGNYHELNDMAIITGIAIDKEKEDYQVSFLIANSQKAQTSTKEGEAQTTVYSAKGKSLAEAFRKMDTRSPKKLYLGHINVVIIDEKTGKEGFLNTADLLLRHPETRKKFYIIQAKDCNAKDILKIISPLESFPSQNIAALLETTNDTQSAIPTTDYNTFIEEILSEGLDPVIPTITVKGSEKKGSSEKNSETTTPQGYIKLDDVAVYKKDKFTKYIPFELSKSINIIRNNIKELKDTFKYKDKPVGFNSDSIKTKVNLKNKNTITINVTGKGFITEINSKTNLENPKTIKQLEQSLNKSIKKDINKTIKEMKTNETDVFGFGNKIYKKYPEYYKKINKEWNSKYFKELNITVKTDLKINSTGSLDNSIKEVNK